MSEEKTSETKIVSLLAFTGEKKNHEVWLKRFTAYSTIKGFAVALRSTMSLPANPDALATDPDVKAKEEKAIAQNILAIACLTMSFTKIEDMEHIENSATTMYPTGVAS